MSLGIAFKGPEGVVLAADSRVTLYSQLPGQNLYIPSTYDNATKLLKNECQSHVAAVTYGLGALGQTDFRTVSSLMLEFEDYLRDNGVKARIKVEDYAKKLSEFFTNQWTTRMPTSVPNVPINDIVFLIGGYDEGEVYGRIFEFSIPSNPTPREDMVGVFGLTYGGQREYVERLLRGFDDSLPTQTQQFLQLTDIQRDQLKEYLAGKLSSPVPYQFLSLQDCVDLSIFLIKSTIRFQSWLTGVRGVGGVIDVATITRERGFVAIQKKEVQADEYFAL